MEGFPSGQREQTVNLAAEAFGGSNPSLPTKNSSSGWMAMPDEKGYERGVEGLNIGRGGSNSVGRVTAFQAVGRGFESRLPLCNK